jgi:hypothetical protein
MDLTEDHQRRVAVPADVPIWDRFFMVAPLVIVGTREGGGGYDLAPKHMAMPLGWENYYCFVCSPSHATQHNVQVTEEFTVSFPRPGQVLQTSWAAARTAPNPRSVRWRPFRPRRWTGCSSVVPTYGWSALLNACSRASARAP